MARCGCRPFSGLVALTCTSRALNSKDNRIRHHHQEKASSYTMEDRRRYYRL